MKRTTTLAALLAAAAASLLPLSLAGRPGRDTRAERLDDPAAHEEALYKRRLATSATATSSAGPRPLAIDGEARGYDVLRYDIALRIDPAIAEVSGEVSVVVMSRVVGLSSVTLDFADGYTVLGAERGGKPITPLSFRDDLLSLPLDPPLGPEGRATLTVRYRGTPPAGGAMVFWSHATGLAATTVAEPFDARSFWPCVDRPDDKAVTTVTFTVPDGYVAATAGLSGPPKVEGAWVTTTWTFPRPISTYLVSLAIARYTVIEETYTSRDGKTTMPVVGYVFPEHQSWNRARITATKDHLETLAGLFGEYPYLESKYGIVEGHFSGGMEHPTLTMIGAAQLGNASRDLTSLLVHELAHQWWGDHVTMATWDDIWLNEGFATYAEVLYDEKTRGSAPGPRLAALYDDGLYSGRLGPPVVADPANPFKYTGAIYSKGAWVLHMLRRRVGDEVFFAVLRTWGERFANGNATRADLLALFEELSGEDLDQEFDQWVETPYRPVLRASYRSSADAGTISVTVKQVQPHTVVHPRPGSGGTPFYRLPVTLRVHTVGGSFDAKVVLDALEKRFDVPNPGKQPLLGVEIDPGRDLLRIVEAVGPG